MKEKFTKGPWVVKENKRNSQELQVWYKHGFLTSGAVIMVNEDRINGESWNQMYNRTMPERESAKEEMNANLHLIAAAPEMYDMLNSIENDANQIPEFLWDKIQSVLAKARGELSD